MLELYLAFPENLQPGVLGMGINMFTRLAARFLG